MNLVQQFRLVGIALLAAWMLAACGSSQEPARHAVENVDAAVSVVSVAGQKYMPEQFSALQARVSTLKTSYDRGDFKQVLAEAPTLLNDAQALGAAAAAKEDQEMKRLASEWTGLTASLPDMIATVQERIDALSKDKKEAAKFNLSSAKASMADVDGLWPKAQEAFASGHLQAAVSTAREARGKVGSAAASLKLSVSQPAAAH